MTAHQIIVIQNLRPAIRVGHEVRAGELGQRHSQIPHKPGAVEKGFVDIRVGHFLSRSEAARRIGVAGLESLDSQILARLQKENPKNVPS
jgi:hypothetical protein